MFFVAHISHEMSYSKKIKNTMLPETKTGKKPYNCSFPKIVSLTNFQASITRNKYHKYHLYWINHNYHNLDTDTAEFEKKSGKHNHEEMRENTFTEKNPNWLRESWIEICSHVRPCTERTPTATKNAHAYYNFTTTAEATISSSTWGVGKWRKKVLQWGKPKLKMKHITDLVAMVFSQET